MTIEQPPQLEPPNAGLGRQLEVFRLRHGNLLRSLNTILTLLLFVGGVGLLLYAIYSGYQNYYRHGPASVWRVSFEPGLGGILLILASLVGLWGTLRNWEREVAVHENGLAFTDWQGTQPWYWGEVSSIRTEVVRRITTGLIGHTTHLYTLIWRDGQTLTLDDSIEHVERLAALVRTRVVPLIFSRYNNAFNTGQTLIFGPVRIHRTGGIEIIRQQYAWEQLKEVTVREGMAQFTLWLSIDESDMRPKVPVSQIPNVDVLLSIVDQIPGTLVGPDETTMVIASTGE